MPSSPKLVALLCGTLLTVACGASPRETSEPGRSHVAMPKSAGAETRTCGSDLVCPIGFVCAKKSGAFTGDCLRAVDEHGAPVEVPHSVDSYGAGPHQCATRNDCPSQFRCDDGRCVR